MKSRILTTGLGIVVVKSLAMSLVVSNAGVGSVFVSSTCLDMERFRRAVEDVVRRKAELACFLSEDWVGGFDDTVEKCKDRVLAAQGFFLLLGYYYGWIPRGEKSITHIEFDCAWDRWKSLPYPPMAVFAPRQGGRADNFLRTEAEKYIPKDQAERALHARRLQAFRSEVLCSARSAQFYADESELRENAIVACFQWKGRTPLAAAGGNPQPGTGSVITDAELGWLGRKRQFDAIDSVLAQFNAEPDQPSVALLVCGDEDAGHRVFLQCLARSPTLQNCRPCKPGHPPLEDYDVGVLVQWVASALGVPGGSGAVDLPNLADSVAAELQKQPLYFMLDRVQGLAGGLSAFVTEFWCPLRDQLAQLHRRRHLSNRLAAFIADYGAAASQKLQICDAADLLDFSSLVRLPPLTDFSQADVLLWLNKMGVPDQPAGRRKQIASSVLKNAAGDVDPKPLRVYERLRSENLFSNELGPRK